MNDIFDNEDMKNAEKEYLSRIRVELVDKVLSTENRIKYPLHFRTTIGESKVDTDE